MSIEVWLWSVRIVFQSLYVEMIFTDDKFTTVFFDNVAYGFLLLAVKV